VLQSNLYAGRRKWSFLEVIMYAWKRGEVSQLSKFDDGDSDTSPGGNGMLA
jgi:hypothetical protein